MCTFYLYFIIAECPPGTYQTEDRDTGIQICLECPKGTYQTEIGQTQCISCPPNRTTEFSGTRSDSRCYCKINYFLLVAPYLRFHNIFSAL